MGWESKHGIDQMGRWVVFTTDDNAEDVPAEESIIKTTF
jgi:hypothetical protein